MRIRCPEWRLFKAVLMFGCLIPAPSLVFGQEENKDMSYFNITLLDILDIDEESEQEFLTLYGFLRTNVEQVFDIPSVDGSGKTVNDDSPLEWSSPNFNLFGISRINERISVGFNIFAEDSDFDLRNAWGNMKFTEQLQLKVGKQYRRFGLFNEKLDETPTFIGIEAPEMLDQDHLLLPRTTRFAVHGQIPMAGGSTLLYALDTDNSESGAEKDVFPLGWDVRYRSASIVVGMSGYFSTIANGETTSTAAVGGGSPRAGVLPWMSGDQYNVYGVFVEKSLGAWLIQSAYWIADHEATRDPASVLTVIANANVNSAQCRNFVGVSDCSGAFTEGDVITSADYEVTTAYFRIGYTLSLGEGSLTPYFHLDYMEHPEVIRNKTFGGDDEAGLADDGEFTKYSIGVVYNPTPAVAIKLDSSAHVQEFNGDTELYPEVRLDFSYSFRM